MTDFFELAQLRHSCRSFIAQRNIERQKLERVLKCALLAPSACNNQPWRYVAVDDPNRVHQLAECAQDGVDNTFVQNASAFIVAIEGKQNSGINFAESMKSHKFLGIDMGLSVANIVLAATDEGLASCIIGSFNERQLKILLGIPKTRRIRLVVALGYDSTCGNEREKQRKPFEEMISYNKF